MTSAIEPSTLIYLFRRRKGMILLAGFACSALATYVAAGLPVRYAASGLLIADTTASKAGDVSDRLTQSDVLRSPTLLDSTVARLDLVHQPQLIPQYKFAPAVTETATKLATELRTLIATLKSAPRSDSAPIDPTIETVRYLKSRLTIAGKDNSRVLKIDFEAGSPQLAAAVVNELMKQFVDHDLATRREIANSLYRELLDRANAVKQEADQADLRVQAFQSQNNVVTLQAGLPAALQLSTQQANLAAAKLDFAQAQAALDASRQGGGARTLTSPALQSLGDRETDVLQRLARAGQAGALNPQRTALNDELRTVRAQIDSETHKVSTSLVRAVDLARSRVASLQGAVNDSQATAGGSGSAQLTLAQLSRDADTKRTLSQSLLARAEDARVAASQIPSAQIVSPATSPLEPEPSRAPMIIVLGFVCGLLLSSTAILARNLLWGKFASAQGLALATGMPGLGSLPRLGGFRRLAMPDMAMLESRSPIAETLRGMRLAIQDMAPSGSGNVILVTSAEAGEGKTTVAAALARRAAGDGLRVLLMEADLRRPRLRHVLGLTAFPTFESALLGRAKLEDVVQIDRRSGLHCVVAQGRHHNPASLLGSERFNSVIASARAAYDLVIIDSPPALRVSDPVLLSRWADIIVFAVRAENTAQALVAEALRRFPERARSRVVTLLTRAAATQHDREGYYSGYDSAHSDIDWGQTTPPAMNSLAALASLGGNALANHPSQTH